MHNEIEILKEKHNQHEMQNPNPVFLNTPRIDTLFHQNQNETPQNEYLIFHNHGQLKVFLNASPHPKNLWGSPNLMEHSSLSNSQPLRAPLTLATGLLEGLEQQEGSMNLQHSFYFRHTQPRCWFEI